MLQFQEDDHLPGQSDGKRVKVVPKNKLKQFFRITSYNVCYTKLLRTTNLNNAIAGTKFENMTIEEILKSCADTPAVRNNGGGFWNHSLFWEIMGPNCGGQPTGELADAINTAFGSFENFKEEFSKAAATRFGSGWAWLCVNNGQLEVCSTASYNFV